MPFRLPKSGHVRNIKLILEYDGSAFFGFQKQPRHPTVQEALEKALSKLLDKKTKISAASGRTDTGVHAAHQVVNFKTKSTLRLEAIQKGLNALLPHAIAIKKAEEVKLNFHARYSALSKVYEYTIWNHPARSPLRAGWTQHVSQKLNVSRMKQAAKILKGEHDFRAFSAASAGKKPGGNTVRCIKNFEVLQENALIRIRVEANGFLYRMVRNLAGSLIEVGLSRLSLADLSRILASRDRKSAPATAQPQGLRLDHVAYSEVENSPDAHP